MQENGDDKVCFVIAPIGEIGSDIRTRSDQVLNHIIRPVVEGFGYTAVRADGISDLGNITTQIIQRLLDVPLVVADLTGRNPNVFYELAVRHAVRKPTIHLIDSYEVIPFDVAPMRTIKFDYHDLDSVDMCKKDLANQIRSSETSGTTETPISTTVDVMQLQQSGKPLETAIADIKLAIGGITSELYSLQSQLRTVAKSSDLPRMSVFSGVGSGTFSHGLGVRPDLIFLQPADGSPITYDSVGSSTVHIETPNAGVSFEGVAISLPLRADPSPVTVGVTRGISAARLAARAAEQAVQKWLEAAFPGCTVGADRTSRMDLVVKRPNGDEVGCEIKYLRDPRINPWSVRDIISQAYYFVESRWHKEYIVFVVGPDQASAQELSRRVEEYDLRKPLIAFKVGFIDSIGVFQAVDDASKDADRTEQQDVD